MDKTTRLIQIRTLQNHIYVFGKIGDFSHNMPKKKQDAIGSQMRLLQALVDKGRTETLSRVVLGREFLGDYKVMDSLMEESGLAPPRVLIPNWESAPRSVWLACMQSVMVLDERKRVWCYTAHLLDDTVEASRSAAKSSPSYYHDRVHRELSKLGNVRFWQALEIKGSKHHIQGALLFDRDVKKEVIAAALRRACGEYPPHNRARQVILKSPLEGDELNWAYYNRKNTLIPEARYGDRPFSYSHGLAVDARALYDAIRAYLNSRRIGNS